MERKQLVREVKRAALARMEAAARTPEDFQFVIKQWDNLDKNRERRERDHEIRRNEETKLQIAVSLSQDIYCKGWMSNSPLLQWQAVHPQQGNAAQPEGGDSGKTQNRQMVKNCEKEECVTWYRQSPAQR